MGAGYYRGKKRKPVDSKGRVSLPSVRVYPKVKEVVEKKAGAMGLSPAYYLLRLVAVDTGYLPPDSTPEELRKWLRTEPEELNYPVKSVAGKALLRVWDGADVKTAVVAEAAGLSYQQAHRQLFRDKGVMKTDLGWTVRRFAEE